MKLKHLKRVPLPIPLPEEHKHKHRIAAWHLQQGLALEAIERWREAVTRNWPKGDGND